MIKFVSFVFILGLLSNLVTMTNLQNNYVAESLSTVDVSNNFFFDKTLDSYVPTSSNVIGLEVEPPQILLTFQTCITSFQKLDHDFIFIDNYLHNIPPPHFHS